MIQSFDYYVQRNLVKKTMPSTEMAKSLIKKAQRRLDFIQNLTIIENNADIIFEETYESIREATQALMVKEGYKPLSHEALIAFLAKFYKDEFSDYELSTLNRYRQLRNTSIYEADPISIDYAANAIATNNEILNKVKKILDI